MFEARARLFVVGKDVAAARRSASAERSTSMYEPQWEAGRLAAFVFLATIEWYAPSQKNVRQHSRDGARFHAKIRRTMPREVYEVQWRALARNLGEKPPRRKLKGHHPGCGR